MRNLAVLTRLTVIAVTALAPVPALASAGPPLTVPAHQLAKAVRCDAGVAPGKRTVLLIHGTGGSPSSYWSWNYQSALPHAGFGVCTVALPDRGTTDLTVSAQYVVHAARHARHRSGGPIAMIGHSQGGTLAVWATTFWPDVAAGTTDVITLAGVFGGTAVSNLGCVAGRCSAVLWQLAVGSRLLRAVREAPRPPGPSYTSIHSRTDELLFPQPQGSTLPGARNIAVDEICPGRLVGHFGLLADSVGHALVMDALRGPGAARLPDRRLCGTPLMPHVDIVKAPRLLTSVVSLVTGTLLTQPWLPREPELPPYAEP
ncbi:lipase family protein [Allokutzneria sp. A3M-2-11 16]|uniref:esterase/lipase family protein n=1 Tax=Allokutzneria sp. A3M-2-11 16 TaxID=2962043 RepID=UPI0020B89C84|nr:lipase family protein [Allokutzneria sp. A3M-2-11 16]MCP3805084.1 lipase family protein [Allokutzneria sp. A3M-2-11 16]